MHRGQESLDLLVRWCQLIGLSPYRMERHAETGRFFGFRFSWRHPLTYWWLTCKVVYVAASVLSVALAWRKTIEGQRDDTATTAVRMLFRIATHVVDFMALLVPELLVFRRALFSKASRTLRDFDALLEDRDVPSEATRRRTVMGIFAILLTVSMSISRVEC